MLGIDYQALEYEETVDETLICPICRTPFHDPITTKNCGHTFCAGCLRRATEVQPVCPIDRQPLNFHADQLCATRIIAHQLDRLKVKCPNTPCEHVTTRGLMVTHYQRYCEHTLVHCPDANCDKRVARMDALPENGCLHYNTRCQYCDKTVVTADLEEHYDTSCSGHTAKCPHCAAMVVRHRMSAHMTKECPETDVRCKWHPFGCTLHTQRKVVDEHEKNGCIYQAIGQLAKDRIEDRMIINDLKGRLSTMEGRVRRVESSSSRSSSSSPTSRGGGWQSSNGMGQHHNFTADFDPNDPSSAAFLYPGGGPGDDRGNSTGNGNGSSNSNISWESPEDYMLAQFERIETKIEDLRKTITELDGRHSVMLLNEAMPLKEQIAELRSNMGVIGMHTTWLMNVQRQSRGQQRGNAAGPSGMASTPRTGRNSSASSGGDGGNSYGGGFRAEADSDGDRSRRNASSRRMSDGRGEHPPRL